MFEVSQQLKNEDHRAGCGAESVSFDESRLRSMADGVTIRRQAACACGGGCPSCQSKSYLNISQPSDPAEVEADQIADKVMRMPDENAKSPTAEISVGKTVHRKCGECGAEEDKIKRKPISSNTGISSQIPGHVNSVISTCGRPLDHQTRGFFEPRMGYDLSGVRIYTDSNANQSAGALDARAYTFGSNIVFGNGEYKPESEAGKQLLAHELAHVLQQSGADTGHRKIHRQAKKKVSDWTDAVTRDRLESFRDQSGATSRMRVLQKANPEREYQIVPRGENFVIQWRPKPSEAPTPPDPAPDAGTTPDSGTTPDATPGPDAGTTPDAATGGDGKGCRGTKKFALTFDDGPHSATLGAGANRTENVLNTLDTKGLKGKAGFFIQTGVTFRGASSVGKTLVTRMHTDGYSIGIHTGGIKDHESHPSAFRAGRLSSELSSAETYIHGITGSDPDFVRAPFGDTGKTAKEKSAIAGVYSALGLTHLRWDIDGDPPPANKNLAQLKAQFDAQLALLKKDSCGFIAKTASPRIVVLYHDVRGPTATNIGDLIDHIRTVVPGATFEKP